MFYGILKEYETLYSTENYSDFTHEPEDGILNEQEFLDILNEAMDRDEGFGVKLHPIYIVLLYSNTTFDHIAETC